MAKWDEKKRQKKMNAAHVIGDTITGTRASHIIHDEFERYSTGRSYTAMQWSNSQMQRFVNGSGWPPNRIPTFKSPYSRQEHAMDRALVEVYGFDHGRFFGWRDSAREGFIRNLPGRTQSNAGSKRTRARVKKLYASYLTHLLKGEDM